MLYNGTPMLEQRFSILLNCSVFVYTVYKKLLRVHDTYTMRTYTSSKREIKGGSRKYKLTRVSIFYVFITCILQSQCNYDYWIWYLNIDKSSFRFRFWLYYIFQASTSSIICVEKSLINYSLLLANSQYFSVWFIFIV